MQHLPQTNINTGGRLFTDRRYNHNTNPNANHINQCLKCPRCDSSNTKFCYYNNYNLSQPRHFCKNCRRYWTKGGVLRNVPVGGGCRKSKRSSKPKAKRSASPGLKAAQHSGSSSESSSNINVAVSTVNAGVVRVSDADFISTENQEVSPHNDDNNNSMMLSGEFMNLITNENHQFFDCLPNNSPNLPTTSFSQFLQSNNDWRGGVHQVEKDKIGGVLDLTATIEDLLDNRGGCGGVATLDWQHPTPENGCQGLFDFTSTVDNLTYWGPPTSTVDWSHHTKDHPLFLP